MGSGARALGAPRLLGDGLETDVTDRIRIAGVGVDDTRHWIGGERIASPKRFSVFSPI